METQWVGALSGQGLTLTWNQSAVLLQTKHSQVPVVHGYLTMLLPPVLSCRTCCLGGSSQSLSWTCLRSLAGFCFFAPTASLHVQRCIHALTHPLIFCLSSLSRGVALAALYALLGMHCGMNEWTKRERQ